MLPTESYSMKCFFYMRLMSTTEEHGEKRPEYPILKGNFRITQLLSDF